MNLTFEENLARLAEVTVKVGLALKPGQEILVTAPLESFPLVRAITKAAYKSGASLVTTLYSDDQDVLSRYQYAPRDSFEKVPLWLIDGMTKAFDSDVARLAITGGDPALLKDQDPGLIATQSKAMAQAAQKISELITSFAVNWSIVAYPSPSWAKLVFPGDSKEAAVQKLWQAIFEISRVDQPNPVATWKTHLEGLEAKVQLLNAKRYAALRFQGPGTDLSVGLAEDHVWAGGANTAKNGVVCVPNIPTEEVFCMPHKDQVEGYVRSTKPLSLRGQLIDGIKVRFAQGKVVEVSASQGEETLKKLLETDQGAARLGEVALVPHSSAVSQSGILFYNTLFDENAASHIALGRAYTENLRNAASMSPEEQAAKGYNDSLIHVDWMIGSDQVDVDGITSGGQAEPLMRAGEWV